MRIEASNRTPAIRLAGLTAWYGEAQALHGVDIEVGEGELVALVGRNGSGRTTTMRAMMGLTTSSRGSIQFFGHETCGWPSHRIARLGVGYCPEERGIYASLSVEENLALLPRLGTSGLSLDELFMLFPNLKERRASQGTRLSGGEQQMLAMARILRAGARCLLLDEITEGLAPVIVDRLFDLVLDLKKRGFTILLVEQNLSFVLSLADRLYALENGQVALSFDKADAHANRSAIERLLSA